MSKVVRKDMLCHTIVQGVFYIRRLVYALVERSMEWLLKRQLTLRPLFDDDLQTGVCQFWDGIA